MKKQNLLLATALVSALGFSAVSQAAPEDLAVGDHSTAYLQWTGFAKVIPGDNVVITGKSAGPVLDGELYVKSDGTFETTKAIDLESRYYLTDAVTGAKSAGDLLATNWTLDASGITASWGSNPTAGMDIKMKDTTTGLELTDAAGPVKVDNVQLSVVNDIPAPEAESLNMLEPLVVNAKVIATVVDLPSA
ncbi:hypothetical protein [uncultured Photobacterium sp.]|uniref:hypothetical protein n=1 Tax=uncultured Photobacterium sp. TaxID=173973 RepID=UPI002635BB9E|nr:hypothetical protein [uncultured Photobacterium sp.]